MKIRIPLLLFLFSLILVASRAEATPYSEAILADSPVVYYQFDEAAGATTAISGGSAASFDTPSTGTAAPIFGVAAHNPNMGTAVDLGSGNGRFDLPNGGGAANYGTYLNVDNSSLSFWINTTQADDGGGGGWNQPTLLGDDNGGCCGGGGSDSWWGTLDNNGTPGENVIGANTGNNPIEIASSTVINDGEWHQVVMTRGANSPANNISLYVDGVLEDTAFFGTPNNTYNTIGAPEDNINQQHLDAMIDELAIFNIELSPEQIAAHFAAATAQAAVPEPASIAIWTLIGLGCFGYYRARRTMK